MSVDVKYRTSATATGGRDGQAATADGSLNIKLATPKELGGAGGPGNNPEQLFAAGYAACFIGAMKAVAPAQKLRVPNDATVTATVGIGPRSEEGLVSRQTSKSVFQVWNGPTRRDWSMPPIKSVLIRMRLAVTSMSASRSAEGTWLSGRYCSWSNEK